MPLGNSDEIGTARVRQNAGTRYTSNLNNKLNESRVSSLNPDSKKKYF